MPTIPTGKLERELKRLYMQWVHQLPKHEHDLHKYVAKFQKQSTELIEKMGGDIARMGALADFPAPKRLDLSLHTGTIYSDMELAAISAQIGTGLNPTDTARALVRSGVDKSYRRLERLARTETVRAYWKNSWDSIEGLGLVMVWGAENGPRTCEWCKERDGLVMDSPALRDHPNGRCTPLPTHPAMVEYRGSIRADGVIYQDPAWGKVPAIAEPTGTKYREALYESDDLPDVFSAYEDRGEDLPEAADFYGGSGYRDMNRALRSGKKPKGELKDMIRELDAELSQGVTKENLQVFRGMGEDGLANIFGIERDWSNGGNYDFSSLIGQTMQERGFMSTWVQGQQLNRQSSFVDLADVILEVDLPAGTKGSKFPGVAGENEFLLPSNSTLVVTDIQEVAGKLHVRVLLTGQG